MLGWAPNTGWDNLPHLEPSALSAWSVSLSYDWQKLSGAIGTGALRRWAPAATATAGHVMRVGLARPTPVWAERHGVEA